MKRINVYQGAVLRWSAYQPDDRYAAWLANCIATNIWGAVGTYTTEVLDADAEWAQIILDNEVISKVYADQNFYKKSDIFGAVSSIIGSDLPFNKALISDAQGKVAASSTTTSTEIGHLSGVTSSVQNQLDGKEATITGAATSVLTSNLTASKVVVSDSSGKIAASSVASSDLANLSGTTSSIQTQLDSKANKTDTSLIGTINWAKDNVDAPVDLSELIAFASTLGVIEGGDITANSGLVINVAASIGYTMSSGAYATHKLVKIITNAATLTLPASSNVYVYYTSSGVLSYNVTSPSTRGNILLGRVVTDATSVVYIEKSELDSHHWANYVDRFLREALGAIFASGSTVTENATTPRQLDMNSGIYYYGEHRLTLASATALSFNAYYRNGSGGYSVQSAASTVSNSLYDDGTGTLAAIPTGKFVKHLLVAVKEQTGTQKFILIYSDSNWSTLELAKAASLPASPEFIKNTFVRLASIVVQEGTSAIQAIIDERPRVGFSPSSVSAAIVTDHGGLTGLSDDDHIQYLLANGSRVLSGDLDFNGNSIINALTVNGVTVQSHASRHQPGGADAIPTATAISIASANAEGASTSLARADHAHKIDDSFITNAMLAGSIDATKIDGGFISNAEFNTLDGINTASTIQSQLDTKQATITGAATTITSSDLTVSRALASDASGKVAVSTTTSAELGFVSGVTSAIQSQLDSKQATITGAATTITGSNLTVSRAVVSDASGKIDVSPTTSAEIGFVSGVTSDIQTQLNGKQATVTGGASTITAANLTASRALASDAGGKVVVSTTTSAELGFVSGVTSDIQTQLNGKEPTITVLPVSKGGTNSGTALNNNRIIQSSGGAIVEAPAITASRALASNASGIPVASATTSAELGFVSGVTSSIQTQLDAKQATGNYITALTGDVSATGPGSVAATLSNTGVTAGTYSLVTVDAKGRVTVGSNSGSITRYSYATAATTSNSTATYTAVPDLTTVSLPVGLYMFRFFGRMQSGSTTNGSGIKIAAGTASITTVNAKWFVTHNANSSANNTSQDINYTWDQLDIATVTVANGNVSSGAAPVANTAFNVWGTGVFRVTVAGTVTIQIRSELNGTASSLLADSVFTMELT